MAFLKSHGVSIVGMSTAVPKNIVSVEEYADKFGNEIVESFKKLLELIRCIVLMKIKQLEI